MQSMSSVGQVAEVEVELRAAGGVGVGALFGRAAAGSGEGAAAGVADGVTFRRDSRERAQVRRMVSICARGTHFDNAVHEKTNDSSGKDGFVPQACPDRQMADWNKECRRAGKPSCCVDLSCLERTLRCTRQVCRLTAWHRHFAFTLYIQSGEKRSCMYPDLLASTTSASANSFSRKTLDRVVVDIFNWAVPAHAHQHGSCHE